MELEAEITKAIENLQSALFAEKYMISLEAKIKEQQELVQLLGERAEQEEQDLKQYENKSINFLFRDILQSDTEQVEIERQEYLHAVLLLKDSLAALKLLEFEQGVLKEKIHQLPALKEILEQLLKRRDKWLRKENPRYESKLTGLYREMDQVTKMRRELFEAKDSGLKCKKKCTRVLELFNKAAELRDWNYNEGIEHVRTTEKLVVDDAVAQFAELRILLGKFERELEDVHEHEKLDLLSNTINFQSSINGYYNYLINDWVVRKKLSSTVSLVEALLDDIVRLINTVDQKKLKNEKLMEALEEKRLVILKEAMAK